MTNKIIVKKPKDLVWPFESDPYHSYDIPVTEYVRNEKVDPFPCITHDLNIVKKEIERVESMFPIGTLINWIVLPHETTARTNAFASRETIWGKGTEREKIRNINKIAGTVVFSGKRTNIHPAMTRFLVSHEFGHHVDYWISACMNSSDSNENLFRKFWCKERGIRYHSESDYGGGKYRNSIMEMIADEVRIAVFGTDPDFWQHDAIPHPLTAKTIKFWKQMKDQYAFKN